ncbi:MAG: hypothetical protein FJW79_04580 [Actinobacteria bacterium]|nr:hypothetical protein [Actinomycetota bacterium]
MRRRTLALIALLAPALLVAAPAGAEAGAPRPYSSSVSVPDLLADPSAYSGATVVVRGELVGDFGRRPDGTVWTQLNGDSYAEAPLLAGGRLTGPNRGIGVRFAADLWPGFDRPGGYRLRGPLVEVTGIWRYHDAARTGESYLDATGVRLLAEPVVLEEPMRSTPLVLGLGLLGAAAAVGLATRRRRDT